MRESLLAATVVATLASATAVAQNASPDNPAKGTAGVNDKMNSSAIQEGCDGGESGPGHRA